MIPERGANAPARSLGIEVVSHVIPLQGHAKPRVRSEMMDRKVNVVIGEIAYEKSRKERPHENFAQKPAEYPVK